MPSSFGFVPAGVVDGIIPFTLADRRALLIFATPSAFLDGSTPVHLDMAGADLAWLNSGRAPVLVDHLRTTDCVVGVVEAAWIDEQARACAVVRFGASSRATEAWADVQAGVLCNVSMGYAMEDGAPRQDGGLSVRRWQPFELSLCALPKCVDAHVKVRGLSHAQARAFYAERDSARAAEAAQAAALPDAAWAAWVVDVVPVLAEVAEASPLALAPTLSRLVAEQLRRLG